MPENKQLEKFKEGLRERGFDLTENWEAPRWTGDKHCVRHFTITGDNKRPAMLTCIIIDYGDDGFGFYGESQSNSIDKDMEAICGPAA